MSIAPTLSARVRRQAANWLVELQSDGVSDTKRTQWQKWHDAHPDHQRAWQCIEAFGNRLQQLSSPLAHAALTVPGSANRRRALKTLAILLFAGSTLLAEETVPWRLWTADRRTGTGEFAVVMLPDGTRVDMNSNTAIDIAYDSSQRLVRLMGGEIMISTAHDPQANGHAAARPFLVETIHGSIRALGTRFTVRQIDADRSSASKVAVYQGAVEIRPNGLQGRILQAGQRTSFSYDYFGPQTAVDENGTAWTQGMIVAQDMPMDLFLAELARYRPGLIRCDPALARLKVSGTYPLADTGKILEMLQTTQPVEIRFRTRYWVTVIPAATSAAISAPPAEGNRA